MYLEFYGLDREPFHITPDPEFLYLSPSHKEALAAIIYGVEQRKGFISITGEVGLGKTTILHSYLAQTDNAYIRTVFVFSTNVTYENLLKFIAQELGVPLPSEQIFEMLHCLHLALIEEYKQGHNVVLIIDEAQNMPIETLENLRMLSNLETSKEKLLQIILVGQPELEGLLNQPQLRQLKQRIAVRAVLSPLSPQESADYIQHRLGKCGRDTSSIFSKSAQKLIIRHSAGIPRKINILCDNALINGYGYMQKPVPSKIIKEVLVDLEGKNRGLRWKWTFIGLLMLAVLAVMFWFSPYGKTFLANIGDSGLSKIQPPFLPRGQSVSPAQTEDLAVSGSQVGAKIRKEVPEPKESAVETTAVALPASQPPPLGEPAGSPVQAPEPVKMPAPHDAELSSQKRLPPEGEDKTVKGSPLLAGPPPASEEQKVSPEKGRATESSPDPSAIVDWLLRQRSTKGH